MNTQNIRIIERNNNDTLLLKYLVQYNPHLLNNPTFVDLHGWQCTLFMHAQENILVNSYKQDFIFNSNRDKTVIKLVPKEGIIYITLPLNTFLNHSYICSLNILNVNITLELNRFQLIINDNYG